MSQSPPETQVIRLKSKASLKQLWDAATTSSSLTLWLAGAVEGKLGRGESLQLYDSNLHARVELGIDDCQHERHLELDIRHPAALAQRARLEFSALTPSDHDDATSNLLVHLTPRDLRADSATLRHQLSAWQTSLAALRRVAETAEPAAPNAQRFAVSMEGPLVSRQRLRELFRTGSGLAQWLSKGGILGPAGSAFELLLHEGDRLCGRVLNDNLSCEVLLACDTWEGTLELRARTLDEKQMRFALQGYSKTLDSDGRKALEERLHQALLRLVEHIQHAA